MFLFREISVSEFKSEGDRKSPEQPPWTLGSIAEREKEQEKLKGKQGICTASKCLTVCEFL
jgi:hypothetical protein